MPINEIGIATEVAQITFIILASIILLRRRIIKTSH